MLISGKKIDLRPFELSDATYLQEMRNDFEGIKGFIGSPFPSNLESEKEWVSRMYQRNENGTIYFAVSDKKTNEFCGYCIARNINYIHRNAEVGFMIHKNARGKGLFADTSVTFYKYLFEQINLHKVDSLVLTENKIAFETDLKIGFENEGIIKEHVFQDGKYKDVYFISLYKEKFNSIHKEIVSK